MHFSISCDVIFFFLPFFYHTHVLIRYYRTRKKKVHGEKKKKSRRMKENKFPRFSVKKKNILTMPKAAASETEKQVCSLVERKKKF
jgi:hypothetical protein